MQPATGDVGYVAELHVRDQQPEQIHLEHRPRSQLLEPAVEGRQKGGPPPRSQQGQHEGQAAQPD
jgi:hypothetical protein